MPESRVRPEGLLRPEVRALSAYHVPDSAGYIKLDAMENPYAWPEATVDAWLEVLRGTEPNRYPDPACKPLKAALKAANGVPAGAEVLLGNGSDEIIQILLMALKPGSAVLAPEPTFVMYRQISVSLGLPFIGVPLATDDFGLDMEVLGAAIESHRPAIIFLAYPNNPTGNLFDADAVKRIIEMAPGLVVVDEAYAPYAGASFMRELESYDNLLVMRTLSKLGLAGLRLGFLAGSPRWIAQLDKVRLPYNINVLTQKSAEFALANPEVFEAQVAHILADRAHLLEALQRCPEVRVHESRANFILLRLLRHDATAVFNALKSQGVLIKNLHPAGGVLSHCLRVTVGKPAENLRFLDTFLATLDESTLRV
jgi:histidinol-phosphate aminotransferase